MLGIFITAAYPSLELSLEALKILHQEKVSLIELGIPFSDPLADGPVIQNASFQALKNGINIDGIFDLIERARLELGLPLSRALNPEIVESNKPVEFSSPRTAFRESYGLDNLILFTYYNPVFVYGLEKLAKRATELGIKGLLIPDLPVDEAEDLAAKLKSYGLSLTLLAAITSTEERIKRIAELSEPFIYLVSRVGITGSDNDVKKWQADDMQKANDSLLQRALIEKIELIKKYAPNKPIGLGFGIDSPEKVSETLNAGVELAIVGTKAIRVLEEDKSSELSSFRAFIRTLNSVKSFA